MLSFAPGLLVCRYPLSSGYLCERRQEALPSSRITPLNTCSVLRSRWCPLNIALTLLGLLPSSAFNPVGFHRYPRLILLTTTIHFSGFNHAACALAFPLLRTPPLSDRTSVPLQARWLTFDLSRFACYLSAGSPAG